MASHAITGSNADEVTGLTPFENLVASAWRQELQVDRILPDDEFFAFAGTDSIVATRMLTRVSALVATEIPLIVVFEFPRLRDFCQRVQAITTSSAVDPS